MIRPQGGVDQEYIRLNKLSASEVIIHKTKK